jgi:predicted RecA/RadA family phage recombinase
MASATFLKGDKLTVAYTAGGTIAVDDILVVGTNSKASVGVACEGMVSGDVAVVDIGGCYIFPKVSGAVIKAGETVDWDVSAGEVDDNQATSASGDVADFGVALEDAGNGVTSIKVALRPGCGTKA